MGSSSAHGRPIRLMASRPSPSYGKQAMPTMHTKICTGAQHQHKSTRTHRDTPFARTHTHHSHTPFPQAIPTRTYHSQTQVQVGLTRPSEPHAAAQHVLLGLRLQALQASPIAKPQALSERSAGNAGRRGAGGKGHCTMLLPEKYKARIGGQSPSRGCGPKPDQKLQSRTDRSH